MKSRPELNGQRGVVIGEKVAATGRVPVAIGGGDARVAAESSLPLRTLRGHKDRLGRIAWGRAAHRRVPVSDPDHAAGLGDRGACGREREQAVREGSHKASVKAIPLTTGIEARPGCSSCGIPAALVLGRRASGSAVMRKRS